MLNRVAGIWPEGADGTDVNGCNRNHKATLLASADDFGKVNLYQYPCTQPRVSCWCWMLAPHRFYTSLVKLGMVRIDSDSDNPSPLPHHLHFGEGAVLAFIIWL